METTETQLRLNQRILVNSTAYYGGQVIETDITNVDDVVNDRVVMTNNHNWGACPSRNRTEVIANVEDAGNFFDKKFNRLIEEGHIRETELYLVKHDAGRNSVSVFRYFKSGSVNSLRDGSYDRYEPSGSNWMFYTTGYRVPQNSKNIAPLVKTIEEARAKYLEYVEKVLA
tara:strand:+ start:881 stop:1393 length:513 start_codon:yes stop_codon:yes gene_type:complete